MLGIWSAIMNFSYFSKNIFTPSLVKNVSWNSRNFIRPYQKSQSCSACFDISFDYQFLFCAACIWKYVQNLALYYNYTEATPFAWIDIVCCGLMNGLFNQELSIRQIPEKDWIHFYTVDLCRRAFIVIKGREVIKQHKI